MKPTSSHPGGEDVGHRAGSFSAAHTPARASALATSAIGFAGLAAVVAATLGPGFAILPGVVAVAAGLSVASYLYTEFRGRHACWDALLDEVRLRGDEHALDLGCGRGAVIVPLARRLARGHVSAIDGWRDSSSDASLDDLAEVKQATRSSGVADRVELNPGSLETLPYDDQIFDLVVSSMVLHRLGSDEERRAVVDEAVRVLEPGGRLIISDYRHIASCAEWLRADGMTDVSVRSLGPRCWSGTPWAPTSAVHACKPGRPRATLSDARRNALS